MRQFNDREALFNQNRSEYSDLDELNVAFKPFYDLTTIASEAEYSLREWVNNPLMKQDANFITTSIN